MTVVNIIKLLFVFATLVVMGGCVPKAADKKATCGANEAFNSVTRSCYSVAEVRYKPVGTTSNVTLTQETSKIIPLTYSDQNSDKATSCSVSGISSNLEIISPLVINGGLFTAGEEVLDSATDLKNAITANSSVSAATKTAATNAEAAMDTALKNAMATYSYSKIISQIGVFQTQASILASLAANLTTDNSIQFFYNLIQSRLAKLTPLITMVENRCECNAGTCSATVVPKISQSSTGGFTYTVTDVDGISNPKSVTTTITALPATTSHLKPVAESSYEILAESSTSTASNYLITLPVGGDLFGTTNFSYSYTGTINGSNQGVTSKGIVWGCMGLAGSDGSSASAKQTDNSCVYTPNSGNDFDISVVDSAEKIIGDLTYTALVPGTFGDSITVQYHSIQSFLGGVDPYLTKTQLYGMISTTYGESFVRVSGNAIKVFINPNITSSQDIADLVNNHPQASKLVFVTVGNPATYPIPSVVTPSAISLVGGADAFDKIPFTVNNSISTSTNSAVVLIKMNPVNDAPMAPKTYIPLFSQSLSFLEEETKNVTLEFTDVDSFAANFTLDVRIDTATPACSPIMTNAAFNMMASSASFTLPVFAPALATCNASGKCTMDVSVQANLDFNGNACLYYTVTDSSAAVSAVQSVDVTVRAKNDTPQLSSTALPLITVLPDKNINEDLDPVPALPSYSTIYAGNGGGVYEADQILTITALSSDPALIPNVACKNYTIVAATPVNAIVPASVGLYYLDTTNFVCYVSTGSATATDWKVYPSLTVFPNCSLDHQGFGAPTFTPSAAGKHYLDKTNNICYVSSATSWSKDPAVPSYKIITIPNKDKSGFSDITVTAKDNGGVADAAIDTVPDTYRVTVDYINDDPHFISMFSTVDTNEGGAVQTDGILLDEDEGSTTDEDAQGIQISALSSDNTTVLPVSGISFFYDLNDNGVQDTGESRAVGANLESVAGDDVKAHKLYFKLSPVNGVDGNTNITMTISDGAKTKTKVFSLVVHPIASLHGGWENISAVGIKTDKKGAPTSEADIQCNYNKATDTKNCGGSACVNTAFAAGTTSPHGVVVPDEANVIFYDASNKKCYRSTSASQFSWVDFSTSCPVTRIFISPTSLSTAITAGDNTLTVASTAGFPTAGTVTIDSEQISYTGKTATTFTGATRGENGTTAVAHSSVAVVSYTANGQNLIEDSTSTPVAATPVSSAKNQYYYDADNKACHISKEISSGVWGWDSDVYIPSKVTLTWKPFSIAGSGAEDGVQIGGWNVYRREPGTDYDFKGGHLKTTSSTATKSIIDPSVRTFTDNTAIAGKVYYYLVRPVDNRRGLPTFTPEIFSEVRITAPAPNYIFAHRWMINQEICNSMNMTTATTNKVDPTKNFRCPYEGPGDVLDVPTGKRFYDYGSDLLVDVQEMGCAYAAAPKCSPDGCIGLAPPTSTSGVVANDLYYDRSSGSCYVYNGGWQAMNAATAPMITYDISKKLNSALNAPLVNITQAKASMICSQRPIASSLYSGLILDPYDPETDLPPAVRLVAKLPSKKDYIAYSSHPTNLNDANISDLEQGFSLNIQSRCNGSAASGLETAYTDSTIPSTSYMYTLPGTSASGIRSLVTGSIPLSSSKSTEQCVSRYGVQDIFGNVAEWTTDTMTCANKVCSSDPGTSMYYDFDPGPGSKFYAFDLVTGPYADTNNDGYNDIESALLILPTGDLYITDWTFADEFYEAGKFSLPTGMPISNNVSINASTNTSPSIPYLMDIGPSSGITTSKLHDDGFILNGVDGTGSLAVGGSFTSGARSGRWTTELIPTASIADDVGFRCIVPIDKARYPAADVTGYNYPY